MVVVPVVLVVGFWGQVGSMWGPDTAIYMYRESVLIIGPLLPDVKCKSQDA